MFICTEYIPSQIYGYIFTIKTQWCKCYELIEETGRYPKLIFGSLGTLQRVLVSRPKFQLSADIWRNSHIFKSMKIH